MLYRIVRDHFETFRARAASLRDGEGLPRFVEHAFRDYLRCGWLAGGFARFRCAACGLDRLVAFSCKGRGLCSSCGPSTWLRAALSNVEGRRPPHAAFAQSASASLAGASAEAGPSAPRTWSITCSPTCRSASGCSLSRTCQRVQFSGAWGPTPTPACSSASLVARAAGALHAALVVPAGHRERLEQVCRYVLRPPVAAERLQVTAEGQVRVTFRQPWRDGTTAIVFDPVEFLGRLAVLIPRPRINLLLYYGVLRRRATEPKWSGTARRHPRRTMIR